MTWRKILKISREEAISDARRFMPEEVDKPSQEQEEAVDFILEFAKKNNLENFDRFKEEVYFGNTSEGKFVWEDMDLSQYGKPPLIFSNNKGFSDLMNNKNPDYDMGRKFLDEFREKYGGYFERYSYDTFAYYGRLR